MNTEHGALDTTDDGRSRLTFVRDLKHPLDKVWAAVTEPEGLRAWFPTTIEGERRPGAALTFRFDFPDAPVMTGVMRAFDPPRLVEFEWGDEDVLRIELEATDTGTRLTLRDTFTEYEKSARDAGGWHACLDNFEYTLEGVEPPYAREDHWKDTTPWYYANFPPEATTAPIPEFHPDAEEANKLRPSG